MESVAKLGGMHNVMPYTPLARLCFTTSATLGLGYWGPSYEIAGSARAT